MSTPEPRVPVAIARLFEYCVSFLTVNVDEMVSTPDGYPTPVHAMNDLGAYGWELIAVLATTSKDRPVGFFRRDLIPPEATTLIPTSASLGQPDFILRVKGSGFSDVSEILWDSVPVPTTFVSPGEVTMRVDMAAETAARSVPVTVRNVAVVAAPLTFSITLQV